MYKFSKKKKYLLSFLSGAVQCHAKRMIRWRRCDAVVVIWSEGKIFRGGDYNDGAAAAAV